MGLSEDSEQLVATTAAFESDAQQQFASEKLIAANDEDETKEDDLQLQQQQQQLESDAALAAAMSCQEVEDPIFLSCQICFDVLLEHETVTRLCGDACTLEVCAECLVQHLTASVYSFYPGVLPKVRCPTCFTLLNKSVWAKFVKPEEETVQQAPAAPATTPVEPPTEAAETPEVAQVTEAEATVPEDGTVESAVPTVEGEAAEPAAAAGAVESAATTEIDAADAADSVTPASEPSESTVVEVATESGVVVAAEDAVAEDPVEEIDASGNEATTEEGVVTEADHTDVNADASNSAEPEAAELPPPQQQPSEEPAPPTVAAPNSTPKFDFSHVLEKYEILCRQSCEFQSPCCHNPEYTMLPPFSDDAESKLAEAVQPQEGEEDPLPALKEHLELFCFHREETKTFYDLLFEVLSKHAAEDALWHVLAMIRDEERRATLLLYHLFLHPDTYTLCCDEVVCFKCKSQVHHDGQCNDFIEDDCVLQCRGCHVTLVKVDGCDSVSCVCGHSIHWPSEMEKQRNQRKGLAPEDDSEHAQWLKWKQSVGHSHVKIASLAQSLREVRLNRLIRRNRAALLALLIRYRTAKSEEAEKRKQQQQLEQERQEQERAMEAQASALDAVEAAVPEAEPTVAETISEHEDEVEGESVEEPAGAQQLEPKRLGIEGELQDEPTPLPAAA